MAWRRYLFFDPKHVVIFNTSKIQLLVFVD